MLDFTSALYLGLRHSTPDLQPWSSFTTGVPAALAAPPEMGRVADTLARLQGCERGILLSSTLHLFCDLFGMLAQRGMALYLDAAAYPIARWTAQWAAFKATPIRAFPHHDDGALKNFLLRDGDRGRRPVVVTDGYCPGCGRPAPLKTYLDLVRARNGYLVIDDTQALGIFGRNPNPMRPYGVGGSGSLTLMKLRSPHILVAASLAKGFGVPLAVLAGSRWMMDIFEKQSRTRTHCSPPSLAVLHAARHALAANQERGEALRVRLAQIVKEFRQRLWREGFGAQGGSFPVQTLAPIPAVDPTRLYRRLVKQNIRTVLTRSHNGKNLQINLLFTANHSSRDICQAVSAISHSVDALTANLNN